MQACSSSFLLGSWTCHMLHTLHIPASHPIIFQIMCTDARRSSIEFYPRDMHGPVCREAIGHTTSALYFALHGVGAVIRSVTGRRRPTRLLSPALDQVPVGRSGIPLTLNMLVKKQRLVGPKALCFFIKSNLLSIKSGSIDMTILLSRSNQQNRAIYVLRF